MRKSTIPFIFENLSLNNMFIEASDSANVSQMFYLQKMKLEDLEINKYNTIIIDKPSLRNFLNKKIKINKVFVIDDLDKVKNDLKYNEETVKISIPFKMSLIIYPKLFTIFSIPSMWIMSFHQFIFTNIMSFNNFR